MVSGLALQRGYSTPVRSNLNWMQQPLDESSVMMISAWMARVSGHSLNTGQAAPDLRSRTFNMLSDGQNQAIAQQGNMAENVAKGIWQNTVGSFIEGFKANPLATVGEVIGVAALVAGAGALDVATGGLATPLLWTGFALLAAPHILPGLVDSIQNEVATPNDQNMTQLLINVGTAGIMIGSPIKAFKGIGATRAMAEDQVKAFQLQHQPGEATQVLLRNEAGQKVPYLLPEDRFKVIPQTLSELEQEVARRRDLLGKDQHEIPIVEEDKLIQEYRLKLHEHDLLMERVQGVPSLMSSHEIDQLRESAHQDVVDQLGGDVDVAEAHPDFWKRVEDQVRTEADARGIPLESTHATRDQYLDDFSAKLQEQEAELIPLQKEFGHRYGYVLARENPMGRVTMDELRTINPVVRGKLDKAFRPLLGILHHAGEGHGWDGAPDGVIHTDFAANLSESMARNDAAGGLGEAQKILQTQFLQGMKDAGVKPERMDDIYAAIEGHQNLKEDTALWEALSPVEKLVAEKMHVMFGVMTNYAYKHGHIELPLHRYVPRMVIHDEQPGVTRGTRSTQAMMEALVPSTRPVQNRNWAIGTTNQQSEWDMANELQDAEFDSEEGMGTLAERLRQTHTPWKEFNAQETASRANYEQYRPFLEMYKSGEKREINGKETTLDQHLVESRREHGNVVRNRNLMQKRLQDFPREYDVAQKAAMEARQQRTNAEASLASIKGVRGAQPQRDALHKAIVATRREEGKQKTIAENLTKSRKGWETKLAEYQRKVDTLPDLRAKQAGVDGMAGARDWFDTEKIKADDLKKRVNAQPGGRKLLSGFDLPHLAFARYLRQMNQARYREAWRSISYVPSHEEMKLAYGAKSGMTLAELALKDSDHRPIAMTGDIRIGDNERGDPHQDLLDNGYEMVMPAMGKRGALNYQPAIFGRKDVVGRYREMAQQARNAGEMQSAFARGVYQVSTGIPKRLIMGSPAWHGKNVTGRALAVFFQHPGLAGHSLFNLLKDRFHNPERYYQAKLDHWNDGGVPANKFNVHEHLNHLEQELTGQRNFLYAMRHPLGALSHAHAEAAEGWFWKTVDDIGTMAHMVKKYDLQYGKGITGSTSRPWMTQNMAGMMAAEYANNVAGMVNPLYMSKLWRWGRQMMFFAPNWWTTFGRIVGQSLPGSARLSGLMKDSKRMQVLDPVKMHSLDIRHRKEMVRMHRGYFTSMFGAAMVTHDLMNFIFSGHHIWENAKGHEWDLEMDKGWAPKVDPSTGETKHAHLHSIQFYSQIADLMNGIGIGHDWSFLHQMNTESFAKANTMQKAGIIGNAVGTGIRQESAGKLSTAVNMGVGAGLGIDPYSLMRDGQVQDMPRPEALMGALPGGYYAQRQLDQVRRAQMRADIEQTPKSKEQLQQARSQVLPTVGKAIAGQLIGLPSMYYSGDEPTNGYHFMSETDLGKYLTSRQQIMSRKKSLSDNLMTGQMTPNDWVIQNEMQTHEYLRLLSDTFGEGSTGASLFQTRRNLYVKYGLDDPAMSKNNRSYATQQFEADWEAQLQHASPAAKAMWWEAHTSMWTDADYLYWMTQQMRGAIAGHIDGEGGNHIREAQRQEGASNLPLDPAATEALRQRDPYLWTYHQVMSQLGKHSLAGSLASAYWDPFASFSVFPDDQAPIVKMLDQAGALKGGSTLVQESTMRGMAGAAKQVSGEVAPEAGELAQTPAGQQLGGALSQQRAQEMLAQDDALSPSSVKKLDPRLRQLLEQVAAGGQPGGQ